MGEVDYHLAIDTRIPGNEGGWDSGHSLESVSAKVQWKQFPFEIDTGHWARNKGSCFVNALWRYSVALRGATYALQHFSYE